MTNRTRRPAAQSSPADDEPELVEEPQAPSYPVQFEDAAFEKAIRKLIGKEEGEILSTDLAGITVIEIWGEEVILDPSINVFGNSEGFTIKGQRYTDRGHIQTLNDVKLFPDLKKLSVNFQSLSDISGLEGLSKLAELELRANEIKDISPLEGLKNLYWLDLGMNRIEDISALEGLENLCFLYLGSNQVSDISALGRLTNLRSLYLDSNIISDISALKGLKDLEQLGMMENKISDISA